MKRTPLKRKTGLKSSKQWKKKPTKNASSTSGDAWSTRSPLKQRTALKKRSKRREKEEKEYSKLRRQFLLENPVCAVYAHLQATQTHHVKGRYGHYLDVSSWLPVSAEGHAFIHNNPQIAKERGWLIYGDKSK